MPAGGLLLKGKSSQTLGLCLWLIGRTEQKSLRKGNSEEERRSAKLNSQHNLFFNQSCETIRSLVGKARAWDVLKQPFRLTALLLRSTGQRQGPSTEKQWTLGFIQRYFRAKTIHSFRFLRAQILWAVHHF